MSVRHTGFYVSTSLDVTINFGIVDIQLTTNTFKINTALAVKSANVQVNTPQFSVNFTPFHPELFFMDF